MEHVAARKPGTAIALRDARDAVFAALDSGDVTAALRATAIDLAEGGLGREGTESVFATVVEELAEAGREEESAVVSYVLDMIAEW